MKLQTSGVARLKEMISLEEKRLALQQDLESVDQQLAALQQSLVSGVSPCFPPFPRQQSPKQSPRRRLEVPKASKARARHGSLKETILSALEAAGNAGVRVKELAASIGIKPVNVHSWFHLHVQARNPSIVKITGGHYRLSGKAALAEPAATKKAKPAMSARAGQEKSRSSVARRAFRADSQHDGGRRQGRHHV